MFDVKIIIPALTGFLGVLIGVGSKFLLHHLEQKRVERQIINETIHYLLELYFQVSRLNSEKMFDAYLDFYFKEMKKLIPVMDEKSIENVKALYKPQLKKVIVPISQKQSFEKLEEMNESYSSMLEKLATVLPIDAFYLRGKNNLKSLLDLLSEYFKGIKSTDVNKNDSVEKIVEQMQPTITKNVIAEYTNDLKKELFVLLKRTDRYNCTIGEKAISSIEVTVLTEEEKREVRSYIINILNLVSPVQKKD